MSRPKRDATGRVRGIGGRMTIRDEAGRAVPAIDGQLDKDGRRVLFASSRPAGNASDSATPRRQHASCVCWRTLSSVMPTRSRSEGAWYQLPRLLGKRQHHPSAS